jgi:hypothetical protein
MSQAPLFWRDATAEMIFAQLMNWIHPQTFRRIGQRHRANYKTHRFSCSDQFLCLAFAQLTYRESLRDIEVCLRSRSSQLYHLGIGGSVSRSTLAHANEHRPWQMYADLAEHLIGKARRFYAGVALASSWIRPFTPLTRQRSIFA